MASNYNLISNTNNDIFFDSGLTLYIQDAMNACSKLEDEYMGKDVVVFIAPVRDKYGLGGRTVRMFTPMMPGRRQDPPEKNSGQ